MKTAHYRLVLSFCLLLACGHVSLAQKDKPVRADWLASDVANVERILPQLKQNEPLTVAALERIFNSPRDNQIFDWRGGDRRLGFGGQAFNFSKAGGYAYLRITGFVFNGTIANYTIALESSSDRWPMIKSVLVDTWKRNGGPEFTEGEYGIRHDREFASLIVDYKKAVADDLGEMQPVNVPPHLKDDYELLISLESNSVVGQSGCGYGAVTPRGKKAIDAIVNADRLDLLANILKGYNPGGRVYAAVALTAMQRNGIKLPPDTLHALEVIRNLDLRLETCDGCLYRFKTARTIIDDWRF
jgi:hypothetical protein